MRTKLASPADQPKPKADQDISDDYEAKGHLQTLLEGEMIKQDPKKMEKIHKLAGRHMKGIKSIQDLKDVANEKFGPKKKAPLDSDGDRD